MSSHTLTIDLDPNKLIVESIDLTPKELAQKANFFKNKSYGYVAMGDESQQVELNYTGLLGSCESMWSSCIFGWLGKYSIIKDNEIFHATNTRGDNPFYQRSIKEKQNLELEINQTLPHLENEHTQIELIRHDLRKAKDLKMMFDMGDEVGLKMMFIDQVDHHSGGSMQGNPGRLSMSFMRNNNIMPTLVDDFIRMNSINDLKEDGSLYNLSKVEKNMLESKWNAYTRWKQIFRDGINRRHEMANNLLKNKKHMLEQRKTWLKPRIARLKMMSELLEKAPSALSKNWIERIGEMRSIHETDITLFKPHNAAMLGYPKDHLGQFGSNAPMYDWFVQENYIYNGKYGLIAKYPWITEDWVESKVKTLKSKSDVKKFVTGGGDLLKATTKAPIYEGKMYYLMYTVKFEKAVIVMRGEEGKETPVEDGTWNIKSYALTKNLMLLYLLNLEAEEEVFNKELEKFVFKHDDYISINYFMTPRGDMTILKKTFKYDNKKTIITNLDQKIKQIQKTNTIDKTKIDKNNKEELDKLNKIKHLIENDLLVDENTHKNIYQSAKYFEFNSFKDKREKIFEKHKKLIIEILEISGHMYENIIFQRVSSLNVKGKNGKDKKVLVEHLNEHLSKLGLKLNQDPIVHKMYDTHTWPNGPYIGYNGVDDLVIQNLFVPQGVSAGKEIKGALLSKFKMP
jgi:hypothetical protein